MHLMTNDPKHSDETVEVQLATGLQHAIDLLEGAALVFDGEMVNGEARHDPIE